MIALKEVKHVSGLARIQFSEKELKDLQENLFSILNYFNKLKEVNVQTVNLSDSLLKSQSVMREDKVKEKKAQTEKDLFRFAPQTKGRFIKVKSVF